MSQHNGSSIICSHVLQTSSLKSATSLPLIWFSVIIVISCMNKLCFSSCVYILETSKLVLFCSGVCYNYLIIFIRYHLIVIYNGCYSYFVAWSVHMYFDTLCMYVYYIDVCMTVCTSWAIKNMLLCFSIIITAFLGRFSYFLYQWKQEWILYSLVI